MSKGSTPRPMASRREYDRRWEATFGGLNAPSVREALTDELLAFMALTQAQMEAVELLTRDMPEVQGRSLTFPINGDAHGRVEG